MSIATERTRMAMPETKIGFFPDVGSTGWMFTRCPKGYPEYLGLTDYDMIGSESVRLGFATHYMKSEYILRLIDKLENNVMKDQSGKQEMINSLVKKISGFLDLIFPLIMQWMRARKNILRGKRTSKKFLLLCRNVLISRITATMFLRALPSVRQLLLF
jgi:enoyl-CoA hydratase/carnithine racemase